jgi:hypothetical protein
MKKIFWCLPTIILALSCFGQQNESNYAENKAYLRALAYIFKQNKDKTILVSDTTVSLNFRTFSTRLDTFYKRKGPTRTYDIFDSIDLSNAKRKLFLAILKDRKRKRNGVPNIVYFSPFYNHMIIGEILESVDNKFGLNYNLQADFNSATDYLFVFDKKYKLKKVFETKIQYN